MRLFVVIFSFISGCIFMTSNVLGADNTSHYLFPAFVKGTVLLKSGSAKEAKMNYNKVTEEMVFDQNGKYLAISNISDVDTVVLSGRKFIPAGTGFYEVLVNAPITLFAQYKAKLLPKKEESSALGASSPTASSATYSVLLANNRGIYELKLSEDVEVVDNSGFLILHNSALSGFSGKKQFLKLFPDKSSQLEQFIKENKLDMGNPEHLVKLVTYCNELYK